MRRSMRASRRGGVVTNIVSAACRSHLADSTFGSLSSRLTGPFSIGSHSKFVERIRSRRLRTRIQSSGTDISVRYSAPDGDCVILN